MSTHDLGDFLQLIFIQADYPHADQIGDVALDVVRRVAFFQGRAVFADKFANALIDVFDAAFHLGKVHMARARDDGCHQAGESSACSLQRGRLLAIEGTKLRLFLVKIERCHVSKWLLRKCGAVVRPCAVRP
ncbi:hypothetical protein D3C71_1812690 [compost metagenome]